MGNSSGENNIIAIIGIILTAISIIVGVLLVKEGREYISRKFRIIVNTVKNLWAQFFIQALHTHEPKLPPADQRDTALHHQTLGADLRSRRQADAERERSAMQLV